MVDPQLPMPPTYRVSGHLYRIISTRYPPIDFFERHVPPELRDSLWALEAETNPRLRDATCDLTRIAPEDRVSGPGASVVMAPFTYVGHASRFSDGRFGVYYAGRGMETAIRETVHHRALLAKDARLSAAEFSMRAWVGTVKKHLHDIRSPAYAALHDDAPRPEQHPRAQAFGHDMKIRSSWGLIYRSVRHLGGECISALRPPAVSLPVSGPHLVYVWDGTRVTQVFEKSEPLVTFV